MNHIYEVFQSQRRGFLASPLTEVTGPLQDLEITSCDFIERELKILRILYIIIKTQSEPADNNDEVPLLSTEIYHDDNKTVLISMLSIQEFSRILLQ